MIFRTSDGQLIEINKYQFINDKLYYTKLLEIKEQSNSNYISKLDEFSKSNKTFNYKNNKYTNK